MQAAFIISFVIYAFCLIGIAAWAHRQQSSAEGFLIGGRKISFWVTALSAHASDMSAWLFVGLPVAVYLGGTDQAGTAIGLVLGMAASWLFVAPPLRRLSEETGSVTLFHFLASRVGDQGRLIAVTGAIAAIFFFVFYIAAGLKGVSIIFHSIFDISPTIILAATSVLVAIYATTGGFVAVALTDAFQAIFLLIVIITVPLVTFLVMDQGSSVTSISMMSLQPSSWGNVWINALGWGLGYFGMPHVLTKFMAVNKASELKKSMALGLSWQVLALSASICVGLIGRMFFSEALSDPETIFVNMTLAVFPWFLCGIIMCGVLAATLSTVDSQVIVAASSFSQDILATKKPEAQIRLFRFSIVGVLVIAFIIANTSSQRLFDIVQYAWSGQGSTFGPIVLCSLYYRRVQKYSAFLGMITGAIIAAVWPYTVLPGHTLPLIPGFFTGLAVIVLGSVVEARIRVSRFG